MTEGLGTMAAVAEAVTAAAMIVDDEEEEVEDEAVGGGGAKAEAEAVEVGGWRIWT